VPQLGDSLRKLATSAAAAGNSMASVESADTLACMMGAIISAHHDSSLYTRDKVVVGKFKYDTLMCNKPPVSQTYKSQRRTPQWQTHSGAGGGRCGRSLSPSVRRPEKYF